MGIHKLMSLLQEKAPDCIKKFNIEAYSGRVVACDASMAMYQFLISTSGYTTNVITELTDKEGNKTGHLVGLFNRTIQFLENGIKPIWVFDGKPPKLKNGELAKRKKMKEEAQEKLEEAKEEGNMEEALKQKQRTTYVSKQMKEDAIKMLKLMGNPVIEAPCEAEAQCAEIVKKGKAFATASEDMDSLTFATEVLLRGFNSKKEPIVEISYNEMINGLGMSHDQFVDLCILCGCDYTETIDGIGPITAFKLIKEHFTIEKVIAYLKRDNEISNKKRKYVFPSNFYYEDARDLFIKPNVYDANELELKWEKPNDEELKNFLCVEKGFSEQRVENGLKKIKSVDVKGYQPRLENFFGKAVVTKRKDNPAEKGKGDKSTKKIKANNFKKK